MPRFGLPFVGSPGAVLDVPPSVGEDVHIAVRSLSVWFGAVQALDRVDLDVRRESLTVLLGPSGCGKSTLLKAVNRMVDTVRDVKVQGLVAMDGRDVRDPRLGVEKVRRRFGVVAQKPQPFPSTVYENVAYGIRLHRLTRTPAETGARVRYWLQRVGLWGEVKDELDARPKNLSLGQQQRLCLARALSYEPEVLLLDEPCAALDPITSAQVESLIRELSARQSVVVSTHNLGLARRMADRVAVLVQGRLLQEGEREEVFGNPRDGVVRDYLEGRTG